MKINESCSPLDDFNPLNISPESLHLSPDDWARLDRLAREQNISREELIADALRKFIREKEVPPPFSGFQM